MPNILLACIQAYFDNIEQNKYIMNAPFFKLCYFPLKYYIKHWSRLLNLNIVLACAESYFDKDEQMFMT